MKRISQRGYEEGCGLHNGYDAMMAIHGFHICTIQHQVRHYYKNNFQGWVKSYFQGRMLYPPLVFAAKNTIFRGGSRHDPSLKIDFQGRVMPWSAPTNPCPENKKGPKKIENIKIKKKKLFQPTSHHHQTCQATIFLTKYTHLHHLGFEPPTPASHEPYFPLHYTATCDSMGYAVLLY